MDNKKEVKKYKFLKVDEARLDRWTSVGLVKQVPGHTGTKGAFSHGLQVGVQGRLRMVSHAENG